MNYLDMQFYEISRGLKNGNLSVTDIGDIIPASLMIHDLEGLNLRGCSYMNNWGCERMGTSADEVNALGDSYYERYFVREECVTIFQQTTNYLEAGDFDKQYNFFQRVKLNGDSDYTWCYTALKVIGLKAASKSDYKVIMLSAPLIGMDTLIARVTKTLEQDTFIRNNYRKFAKLTRREKEIIGLVVSGKSTAEIADQLFLSSHTVSTHRKNLSQKIECKSFAELVRFAMAFDLIGEG